MTGGFRAFWLLINIYNIDSSNHTTPPERGGQGPGRGNRLSQHKRPTIFHTVVQEPMADNRLSAFLQATQETHRNIMILHCRQYWEESEMIIGYGPPPTKAALTMQLATKDLQQNPEQSQHKEKSAEPWHDAWTHQATIQTPTHTPCTQLLPRHGTPTMTVIPCKTHSMKNIGILSPLLGQPDTTPSGKDTGIPAWSSDLRRGVTQGIVSRCMLFAWRQKTRFY